MSCCTVRLAVSAAKHVPDILAEILEVVSYSLECRKVTELLPISFSCDGIGAYRL
jgi:hypothetical protein